MITLALDASTYEGTVAVLRDGRVAAYGRVRMRGEHEERLMPAVADAMARAGVPGGGEGTAVRADRIVCGEGPGSFTSLRIAASIAKGLATGWGCPLYAVSSLALVAAGAEPALPPGRYLAALDALRGEVYAAVYAILSGGGVELVRSPWLLPADRVAQTAAELDATVVGRTGGGGGGMVGAAEPGGVGRDLAPDARGVAVLEPAIVAGAPVDLASWEPTYGRLAEAQVKWEAAHGRALPTS